MGQGIAIAIAIIAGIIGAMGSGAGGALIGVVFVGGLAWMAFAWKPSTGNRIQNTPEGNADHSHALQSIATPSTHQSLEDIYAIFFSSSIAGSLELAENSPEAESISQLIEPSSLNQDKMILNIWIVDVALCMVVINFLSDLKTKTNVTLLMEKLTDHIRNKLQEITKQTRRQVPKSHLTEFARTESEKKSLAIVEYGYEKQNFVPLDALFSALFHHRVVEYLKAYANSNDQPLLGGRAADVARLFCVNLLGENFGSNPTVGAMLPMSLTPLFNVTLDTLIEGLEIVQRHPELSGPSSH